MPQCSTPSQSSRAAARLKSANLSTASEPAPYLGPILSATKGFACPLFIVICKANPLNPLGSGILRRPPFSRWSQANLRPYQAPSAACTVFSSTLVSLWRFLGVFTRRVGRPPSCDFQSPPMIPSGPATRVFMALEPVDMRKGYDGLYGLVTHQLGEDPRSGHLFAFTNRLGLRQAPEKRRL